MAAKALGTWENPPLAYVVAELIIAKNPTLEREIPAIQETLRDAYPRPEEVDERTIGPTGALEVQKGWQSLAADSMRGIRLSSRTVSLHATSYVDFADFLQRWQTVLEAVESAGVKIFVERAGLRYVDLIVPGADRKCQDYVAGGLRGMKAPQGSVVDNNLWATSFTLGECSMNARIGAPAPQHVVLPPNFRALPLEKPEIMFKAEHHIREGKPIGFVDTDCVCRVAKWFSAAEAVILYRTLHDNVSLTFKSVLSELAEEEWR